MSLEHDEIHDVYLAKDVRGAVESLKAGVLDKVEAEGGDLSYYKWLFKTRIGDI